MRYQNLCLLPDLNLNSFSFEPLFHCFLLALIGGICFPIIAATCLFKSAQIYLTSPKTFTVTCSPIFSTCISSFTSIFPISFSKYAEFSKCNCRIITDASVGGKGSCLSLLLHHPSEHHTVVLNFLCWDFMLNGEYLCLLCVYFVLFNKDSFSFSFQAKDGF